MKILIIGGGSIGALKPFNLDNPSSKNIITHAHAAYHLRKNKIIEDFYIIEIDSEKREEIKSRWKCRVFKSIEDFYSAKLKIEIIVIATPQYSHHFLLKKILMMNFKPELFIVEKPFCDNIIQASEIYNELLRKEIPTVVNYTRRFSPMLQSLAKDLKSERYGKIQSCNIIYVRGLQRDASHAIDLCNYFFGEFLSGEILGNSSNGFADYSIEDLAVPVWMEYSNCKNIYMTPADGRKYSMFEMDILTDNSRISLIDHCRSTRIFGLEPEKVYGNFKTFSYNPVEDISNDLESALLLLHGNCVEYLNTKEKNRFDLFCTSLDALKVRQVISKLIGE